MVYKSYLDDATIVVEKARQAVAKAMEGRDVNAINKANRALADAYDNHREVYGGNVPDRR